MSKYASFFTVPSLLSALVAVGGLTLGLFAWDAERAIGRLDNIENAQSQLSTSVSVVVTRVDGLTSRTDALSGQVADHEKRLTFVELKGVPRP